MIAQGNIGMVLVNTPESMGSEDGEYILMRKGHTSRVSGTKEEIAAVIWEEWCNKQSVR
jgi:phosphopantothenoylcysteine decarboxylase/phosphopantothenate--cysteine ligase